MLADLGWLTATAARDAGWPCLLWVLTAVGQGLLVPAQLWLTKLLVDALAARLAGGAGAAGHHALLWLGLVAAALLAGRALAGLQDWVRVVVRERQGPPAQLRVMRRAAELELATFEHPTYYDQANRVLSHTEGRVPDAVAQVIGLGQTLPPFFGYIAALAILSPTLLVVGLAASLPTVIAWTVLGQAAWGANARFTRMRRLADYYAGLLTGRGAAKEIRLYGLADYVMARWSDLFWRSRNGARRQALRNGTGLRAMGTASVAASMLALWFVALHGGHHSAGTYTVLFQSVEGIFGGAFQVGDATRQIGENSGFAAEYRAFFRGHVPPAPDGLPDGPATACSPSGLCCHGVTFTYPGAAAPALTDVDLAIRPGERVALVGENGAGKTTLTKVLLGLYRPQSGTVTLDGIDVRRADPRRLSAVFQDAVHYQLTLAENVGISAPERLTERSRLVDVLMRVGATDLTAKVPDGLDGLLGLEVSGTDLSGGQWQRLAMARALWRDPDVLVLDEPTAALDPLAELEVFRQFAHVAEGRTTIFVSHRLGVCRLADRIVVLQAGRVVEDGPHDALLAAGGPYAQMFAAQARWYR